MKNLILIFLTIGALVGCGIKGDPLPPSETETVQKGSDTASKKESPATTTDMTVAPGTAKTTPAVTPGDTTTVKKKKTQ